MIPFNRDYELSKQYQQDNHQQADNHRLAKSARTHNPKRGLQLARVYKPTLFKLGEHLESIGTTLQVRYGDLKPRPSNR